VATQLPNVAQDYTANKAKHATTSAAWNPEAVFEAGRLNADFSAASIDDGMRMVATGEGDLRLASRHAKLSKVKPLK
jgi:raffinose/stachyose/melibiose transport system substrate-binding protein